MFVLTVLTPTKSQETKCLQSPECKPPVFSLWPFQVQSGKDSVPRRKAPGIPVNKDTPVRKFGKRGRRRRKQRASDKQRRSLRELKKGGVNPYSEAFCGVVFVF